MIQYPQISPKDKYMQDKARTYCQDQVSPAAQNQLLEIRKSVNWKLENLNFLFAHSTL